ncbi:sodium:calcium antiporter [Evansella sp. AB-P1]|uniref:sodium:calcium antiporter n=1 Tax=Evansella sp. AB-P1 TaxID=3037653 RepID=UPI00241DF1C8|nr:sodium:calcium antiporter [Evansella sp. AB-P1]MDG5789141.1 sodium:calcium antiporter [Evansella sp. AB-P1]
MMYLLFFIAAIITVFSAIKLSTYADVLSERTSLGGMLVGTLLLAGATSLPEVTTSATAIFVNNPDIAIGNVLGSNLFNLLILAVIDIIYRRRKMMTHIHKDHLSVGFIGLGLTALIFMSIINPSNVVIFGVGIECYLLIIFYFIGMKLIASKQNENTEAMLETAATELTESHHTRAISLKRAKIGFALAAFVIFISGSLLTISGDAIAVSSGMSSSFVGSFLIAGATSLPELVTVIVAIQLLNYNLAIGNILGSNIFNMLILVLVDILYRDGSILAAANPVSAITALAVIILNIIVLGGIIMWQLKSNSKGIYSIPSLLLVVVYFVSSYLIFSFS